MGKKRPGGSGELGKTDYNFEWNPDIYDGPDWTAQVRSTLFHASAISGRKVTRRHGRQCSGTYLSVRDWSLKRQCESRTSICLPITHVDPVLLRDWAAYLDAVRFTDKHVGEVIARLEREGILDETLIIFMTDHGISHARGKQFLYDEGTHIPFVVRGPGIGHGQIRDDLIEHIDIAAISLAAAGIPIPKTMHGRNVFAGDYTKRDAVFAARDRCDETVDRIRSIRTDRYLYIRNFHPHAPASATQRVQGWQEHRANAAGTA